MEKRSFKARPGYGFVSVTETFRANLMHLILDENFVLGDTSFSNIAKYNVGSLEVYRVRFFPFR